MRCFLKHGYLFFKQVIWRSVCVADNASSRKHLKPDASVKILSSALLAVVLTVSHTKRVADKLICSCYLPSLSRGNNRKTVLFDNVLSKNEGYLMVRTYEEYQRWLEALDEDEREEAEAVGFDYLRLNDNIITRGTGLYHGKMLG